MSSVSVIVPSYNYAHFLEGCVQSVTSQAGVDLEVLIIDDCSQDETPAVAPAGRDDGRITVRRHSKNRGLTATCNAGLEWASSDYSVVLSADDLLTPGALSRATAVMDEQPGVGLVYGRSLYFRSNDELPQARSGVPRVDRWDGSDWIAQRCKTATSCISSPEVVVRTSLQKQLGGYRVQLPHAGDFEMWLRFAAHADVVYLGRVDQAFYRKHPQSMMRTTFADPLLDLQQRKAAFDALFDAYDQRITTPKSSALGPTAPSRARHYGERAERSIAGGSSRCRSTSSKRLPSRPTRRRTSSASTPACAGGAGSGPGVVSCSGR